MSATTRDLFHWADYALFSLSLASTVVVGIFFAIRDRLTSQSSDDYLMAGRKMNWFLVAQSVFASASSATVLVGLTTEYYYMGNVYLWSAVGMMIAATFIAIFTVPKFFRMRFQVTSAYEYFQHRFNLPVRMLVGIIYVIFTSLYMAVVLYVPSLVFSQVTGLNVRICISVGAIVCLIYTSLGGMKAVIWVDNIQVLIIFIGISVIIIKGLFTVGGFGKAWEIYKQCQRNIWNDIDLYPWDRHTVWNCIFLFGISMSGYGSTHQMLLQRYMTVPSMKMSQTSVVLGLIITTIVGVSMFFVGVGAFALLGGNEPMLTGRMTRADGIFPLYIMQVIGHLPGLPGLIVSALYAAALSCLSSGQNALAAVLLEDLLRPIHKLRTSTDFSERSKALVCKVAAVIAGLTTLALSLIVPYFDDYVYSMTRSAESFISGPVLGVLVCAMFLGYVESWGVFIGCLASVTWAFHQYIGWLNKHHKHLGYDQPPVYLMNFSVELTIPTPNVKPNLYDTSYQWYALTDAMIVIILASLISPLVHLYRHKGCFQWSEIWPSEDLLYTFADFKSALGFGTEMKRIPMDAEISLKVNKDASQIPRDEKEDNAEDGEKRPWLLLKE